MIFSYFVGIFCFSVLKSHISVLCKVGGGFNDRWANEVLAPTAQLAINGEGDFKAGEHCRFCKVRTICRKRAEYNLELARYDFESPATLDDIEIATILTDKIAAGLERDGILTGAGNPRWHTSTVAKILRNEKYMGDALLQKTYTVDYLSKKRIKNNGIMPQYYVENDHEAIIPKEIFMRVQDELVRRRLVKVSPNGRKHGFSSNHVFSQMIVCGECGELFRRVHWNNHGCRSIVWRCLSRLQSTGVICHARTVNEEVLKNVVLQAFNELLGSKSTYQKRLQDNLAVVLRGYEDEQAFEIDKRLAELQQELINHASRKEDYNDIADEIFRLREMKQKNFTDSAVRDEQVKRINELNDFISQQDTELTEFDESLARRWLKEITVWDDRFLVELKSGVVVEIMV